MPYISGKAENRKLTIRVLVSPVKDYGEKKVEAEVYGPYVGLLDTGAQSSCITRKVVEDAGLIPVGVMPMITASDSIRALTYDVRFAFINPEQGRNFIMPNIIVASEIPSLMGVDVIIGMDIIGPGTLIVGPDDGFSLISP